jgi:hypothetical protein
MNSRLHSTLNCNFCRYNLTVSEELVPWASEVMLAHAKKIHPAAIKETLQNAQDPAAPSVPV